MIIQYFIVAVKNAELPHRCIKNEEVPASAASDVM